MISRTFNVDGKSAVAPEKQNELEYFKSHAIAEFVTCVSDLETETVVLYERTDDDADRQGYGQHEYVGEHVLGEGLGPNQWGSTERESERQHEYAPHHR